MTGAYHELKKLHYLNLIKECAQSGKNNRAWCSEIGIAYSTFLRWQAQRRDEAAERVMERQVIVPVKRAPPEANSAFPVEASVEKIQIRKGELSVVLPSTLPAAYVLEIVKGLA